MNDPGADSTQETSSFSVIQYNLLLTEWGLCNSNIGRLDTILFVIRGWTVTLATVVIAYAYTEDDPAVCYLSTTPLFLLWLVDALFKSIQRNFIIRSQEIEQYLSSDVLRIDLQRSKLSIIVPAMSAAFGHGSNLERLARVLRAGVLTSVMISYLPVIIMVLAVGALLQWSLIHQPHTH